MKIQKENLLDSLDETQRHDIQLICSTLKRGGFEAYLVGGAVRNLLLGKKEKDLDFTTNARPKDIQRLFKKTVPTGIQHGTITVLCENRPHEVTTYRAESQYTDARRPDQVFFSDHLSEDLKRRDFTVNAFALDPLSHTLIDEHDGMFDLENRIIRTIGDAKERFYEDGLRTVRACRFLSTLDFVLDEGTKLALSLPDIQERAKNTAIERFTDELRKGFAAEHPSRMIESLEDSGLLKVFLKDDMGLGNKTEKETLANLDQMKNASVAFKLAYWWKQDSREGIEKRGKYLKLSNLELKWIQCYALWIDRATISFDLDNLLDHKKRELLSQIQKSLGSSTLSFLNGIPMQVESLQNIIKIYNENPIRISDLKMNGNRLQEMGFQGKMIGEILEKCLQYVLEFPEKNNEESLIQLIEKNRLNANQ